MPRSLRRNLLHEDANKGNRNEAQNESQFVVKMCHRLQMKKEKSIGKANENTSERTRTGSAKMSFLEHSSLYLLNIHLGISVGPPNKSALIP